MTYVLVKIKINMRATERGKNVMNLSSNLVNILSVSQVNSLKLET